MHDNALTPIAHLKISNPQVSDLLDSMALSQYKESFLREHVSGNVLLSCSDSILEEELGVSVRLHRIRLMLLISGKTPVASFKLQA